jgi:hypothetical protein
MGLLGAKSIINKLGWETVLAVAGNYKVWSPAAPARDTGPAPPWAMGTEGGQALS